MSVKFGGLLKEARLKKRITLRKLGEQLGYAASFLSEVENGVKHAPKDESFLRKMAQAVGLDADSLIKAAQENREEQNPKRLKGLLRKDPELAACFLRVSREVENDEQLARMLHQALQNMEGQITDERSSDCSQAK